MIERRDESTRTSERDFDSFLHFTLTRNDGGDLTGLSLLARLNRDPLHIARQLASMPRAQAIGYITYVLGSTGHGMAPYPAHEVGTWIDRLPKRRAPPPLVRVFARVSLAHLFVGFNVIFLILLCVSLTMPLAPRNAGDRVGSIAPSSSGR